MNSLWRTRIRGSTSVNLSKGIVVLPLSLFLFLFLFFEFLCIFWWPQWLFLFNSHLSSLGSFILTTLGSFPHLRATLYFTRRYRRSFTLYKVLEHKEDVAIMMYENVCLCQCSRNIYDMKIKS